MLEVEAVREWDPVSSYLCCVLKAIFHFSFCADAGWQDADFLYTLMFLAYCVPWQWNASFTGTSLESECTQRLPNQQVSYNPDFSYKQSKL